MPPVFCTPFVCGFSASEAKRLKALEAENARLKRLLAEKELEIQALTEILKKTA